MEKQTLTNFSEQQRINAMKKYKIIEPYLNKQETIKEIAIKNKVPTRTLYRWVQKYEHDGLVGLIRKIRTDFEQIRVSEEVRQKIEEFVLRYKKISTKRHYLEKLLPIVKRTNWIYQVILKFINYGKVFPKVSFS